MTERPDEIAMDRARLLKGNAHSVGMEATVGAAGAIPAEHRVAFMPRARMVGTDAVIESVALSMTLVAQELPVLSPQGSQGNRDYAAGWNAARDRSVADANRVRAALVALRPRGFTTHAEPETQMADADFAEALYLIWALADAKPCVWGPGDEMCTTHPRHSVGPRQCPFDQARDFLESRNLAFESDDVLELREEARVRREHVRQLTEELPEEGGQS
jgi:hypothetical protein